MIGDESRICTISSDRHNIIFSIFAALHELLGDDWVAWTLDVCGHYGCDFWSLDFANDKIRHRKGFVKNQRLRDDRDVCCTGDSY